MHEFLPSLTLLPDSLSPQPEPKWLPSFFVGIEENITKRFAIWKKIFYFARRWITFRFFFFVFSHTSTSIFFLASHFLILTAVSQSVSLRSLYIRLSFSRLNYFVFRPQLGSLYRIDIRAESAEKGRKEKLEKIQVSPRLFFLYIMKL